MIAAQAVSSDNLVIVGCVVLAMSASLMVGAVWHFDWMRRRVPFLLRWGRGSWSFPASRFGLVAGSLVGLTLGSLCLDSRFKFLPRAVWGIIVACSFAVALVAAARDFRLWRRQR